MQQRRKELKDKNVLSVSVKGVIFLTPGQGHIFNRMEAIGPEDLKKMRETITARAKTPEAMALSNQIIEYFEGSIDGARKRVKELDAAIGLSGCSKMK